MKQTIEKELDSDLFELFIGRLPDVITRLNQIQNKYSNYYNLVIREESESPDWRDLVLYGERYETDIEYQSRLIKEAEKTKQQEAKLAAKRAKVLAQAKELGLKLMDG